MSPASSRTRGSHRWFLTIAAARGLARREKALLLALAIHLDWDTGVSAASMAALADAVGWGPRAMQLAARTLEARGIVTPLDDPCAPSGGPNRIRLHLDALEAHRGAPRARAGGAREGGPTRTRRPEGAHAATEGGAPRAPIQFREQQDSISTTKTTGADEFHVRGCGAEGGGDGGGPFSAPGGGGADSAGRGPHEAPLVPEPHDPEVSRQRLLDLGVSRPKAGALALRHAPEVIDDAMAWLRVHGKNSFSPAGLLVTILEDGTALEAWRAAERRRRAEAAERAAEERHARRCGALRAAFGAFTTDADPVTRAEAQRRERLMLGLWPTLDDLARSGVVPDELLFAGTINATAVVDAAWEAALLAGVEDTEVNP